MMLIIADKVHPLMGMGSVHYLIIGHEFEALINDALIVLQVLMAGMLTVGIGTMPVAMLSFYLLWSLHPFPRTTHGCR